MSAHDIKRVVEAALLAAGRPLAIDELTDLFEGREIKPDAPAIREAIEALQEDWQGRGVELSEVASGYRFQVTREYSGLISRLWAERPARYSRALLETLALIAYRQPVTRGEIEDVRGVSVSSTIMKTLMEREWIRVLGHRDVPGRPAIYGTTRGFLDDFSLASLESLPPLAEIRDLDQVHGDLFGEAVAAVSELTEQTAESPASDAPAPVTVAMADVEAGAGEDAATAEAVADDHEDGQAAGQRPPPDPET